MLTVRKLIAHLEALAAPDAAVFFGPEDGTPVLMCGGILKDHKGAPGGKILLLSPITLDQVGGF